ncbi:MAG: thioesterase family protein [Pirellulales bacterium]
MTNWQIHVPHPLPEPLQRYPVVIAIPVQWGNMDALGHVNNVAPIRWFESGRVALLERLGVAELMTGEKLGPILAAVRCSYRRQLHYPDTVLIANRVSQLGRTSVTVEHAIYSMRTHHVTSEGESVVVVFDYQAQRPVRVPDDFRDAVLKIQTIDPPRVVGSSSGPEKE